MIKLRCKKCNEIFDEADFKATHLICRDTDSGEYTLLSMRVECPICGHESHREEVPIPEDLEVIE